MTQAAATNRTFPCRSCGARLEFAPGTSNLKCPYCSAENEIAAQGAVEERDFEAALATLERDAAHVDVRSVTCARCAAEVTLPPNVTSLSCPFCGSPIVSQPHSTSRLLPNAILPFLVTREQALAVFRAWLADRWFAPTNLKKQGLLDDRMNGVYLPAWTYDAHADTAYAGERGDAYYVPVTRMVNGRPQTSMQRRVRWSSKSGRVRNDFDDVLILASLSLPSDRTHALEPWDLKACVPYDDAYLAGFKAECYQIGLSSGFGLAQKRMEPGIDASIRADIGGDEQRIHSRRISYSRIRFKHLVLPVWVSAYRYRQRVYRFLVNARTGEVQGERPYSWPKISLAVVMALLVFGAIAWFVYMKQ